MASPVEILLAGLPLLLVGILLVGFLWPATRATPISWLVAVGVGYVVWNNPPEYLAGASIVGVMTALEILWIIFGALVLLYMLMEAGAFDRINEGFASVSEDRRVQIVLIAFFLTTFIEGAAGFGSAAAVAAPLMLALGFPALAAVVAALIGHTIAVTYGAVGTPIHVGVESPLQIHQEQIVQEGEMSLSTFATEVAAWAATLHTLVGFVMPLFAVGMVVYFFDSKDERSLKPLLQVWPLCLFAGVAFAVPYWLSAWFLTAEFPSIIGAMVGGALTIAALRAGYLQPDDEWEFPAREEWPSHWVGTIEPGSNGDSSGGTPDSGPSMSLLKAWAPYILLVGLLIVTRVIEPVPQLLVETPGFVIEWTTIFGYENLSAEIEWINAPGFWLLVSASVAIPLYGMNGEQVKSAWTKAGKKIVSPVIALVFVIAMVEVMINSGDAPGAHDAGSMMDVLAITTANIAGAAYPSIVALIGALGAAMAGSNTVSNIAFGSFHFTAAQELGLPTQIIVAAQTVGGAVGNIVAIHNVVAALATVGLVGQEGRTIRLNLIPVIYYTVFVGLWTMVFTYVFFPNIF
ncbi:L-lactate permease [Natronococcus occultus]|uniref:L-lactate permease n=1 Tax=Natronococcus occultus SP4 TaxID=694430 RepID=L0K474_9EURY|nr:L-lactate permease [Natronococcus occultus]AGB38908.1 L-lactate permease [Natronococcus occultus SP4]